MRSNAFIFLIPLSLLLSLVGCKEPNEPQVARSAPAAVGTVGGAEVEPSIGEAEHQPGQLCNIESIDGQALGAGSFRLNTASTVRGWLADEDGGVLDKPMLVLADENKGVIARYPLDLTVSRPDVIDFFPARQIPAKSGFEVHLDPAGLPPQTYRLYLTYIANGTLYVCDNGRKINLPRNGPTG